MNRVDTLRFNLIEEIETFLNKYDIKKLNAYDVDEGSSPIIIEDKSTLEDNYTLDRIEVDRVGDIYVDCSSTYGNDTLLLADCSVDAIEGVLDWLSDNEDTIAELVEEIDDDE